MANAIEAQEGHQGIHRFFAATMKWGELAHLLVFPDRLGDLDDDEQMQRGVARGRIPRLVRYVADEPDHFFSALTLIILPRDRSRPAHEGGKSEDDDDEWDFAFERRPTSVGTTARVGTLYLSGEVNLFPADGQHRALAGIEAMEKDPNVAKEQVPVVLVPYKSADQVRQLFSDLNLNAKPVSKTIGWDFSHRDPVALVAKGVMQRVELFRARVNRRTNSLPASSQNVITLNTLVMGCESIAAGLAAHAEGEGGKGMPVAEYYDDLDGAIREIAAVWDVIVDAFAEHWDDVIAGTAAPGDLRADYVFPHGLGWQALAQAAGTLLTADPAGWEKRFRKAVARLDWRRQAKQWDGTIVIHGTAVDGSPTYRVNNTAPAVKDLVNTVVAAAKG